MRSLVKADWHLPLFAAQDIVCSFFLAPIRSSPMLSLLPVYDDSFRNLYSKYPEFLGRILQSPSFKRIGDDLRRFTGFEQIDQLEREWLLYYTCRFVLSEMAMACPFVSSQPIYRSDLLARINWKSFKIPEREGFQAEYEKQLLMKLKLQNVDTDEVRILPTEKKAKTQIESLIETIFRGYRDKTEGYQEKIKEVAKNKKGNASEKEKDEKLQHQKRMYLQDLSRFAHLFDYKLIDLYLNYYDRFEASDQLRHKIALLDLLSRIAVERSPFNSEYSTQWRSGLPNPAHLVQGWLRFFLKTLEGAPVFLGYPDPIYDQDKIAVRFYIIEEMKSLSEKIKKEEGYPPRFSHVNIHKLISLLVSHDLVRYLGNISKMDITLKFLSYYVGVTKPVRPTDEMSIKALRGKHKMEEGFMIRRKELQKTLFFEPSILEAGPASFDPRFFNTFFQDLESSTAGSASAYARIYDIFFARGGAFLYENDESISLKTHEINKDMSVQQEEFNPSTGLADVLRRSSYRILPTHPRSFIFETNHRYLFVAGDTSAFKTRVINNKLDDFLSHTREYFLDVITEEAIRFRLGYIERMKR